MPIYKPNSEKAFLTPFGPTVGYFKMSEEVVNTLNSMMNENLKDFSDDLVGKVKQELQFSDEIKNYIGNNLVQFLGEYHTYNLQRNSFGNQVANDSYKLFIHNGWFVRQFENEYNPIHIHTGCTLSCVGYLSLPDGIDDEWEEDYKDHYPANGHINFTYGVDNPYGCANMLIKPQVGDFYVFPQYLFHCVYPFKTKGERRSFSMNMSFAKS
jgi:hypothetical protein